MHAMKRNLKARALAGLAVLVTVPAMVVASAPAAGAAGSNTLKVTAGEYTYKVSGAPKPGNVEIVFDNAGSEYHMFGIVPLKPKVTVGQLKKALLSDDESASNKLVKGDGNLTNTPGFLGPDQSTTVITNLPAGHYGLFCFVSAPDGAPHVAHGMVKTFDVKGSKSTLQPPTDGVVDVNITDAGVEVPSSGIPAKTWVKVTNNTSVARDLTLGEFLTPDATYESANAYFQEFFNSGKFPAGDPPASLNGGIQQLAPGSSGYVELSLTNGGKYVFVSSNNEVDNDPNELHTDFTAG
jgi:hypothetical protein